MQVITRYIFSQLLAAALAITLVLTTVFFLVGSLRWIGCIVNRGLPASTFSCFIALLLPSLMSLILPIAAFCATLLVRSEQGPRVVLVNGNRQQIEGEGGRLSLLEFDRYVYELSQLQGSVHARWREPRERYLHELFGPSVDPDDVRNHDELIAEGHQRLAGPLQGLSFVLVALAALLSGHFNRRGQVRRVLAAILCIPALEALSLASHDMAIRSLQSVPVMYAASILPGLGAMVVLLRAPRRARRGLPLPQAAAS